MSFAVERKILSIVALSLIMLAWPVPSQARSGGSKAGGHKEITITKTKDKSSPKLMDANKTNSSVLRGHNSNNQKGGRYLAQ
ncbi:MAG TPA: hypothetical protein VJR71_16745 [Pseudolabrys sp.]|nr:hypothetical protein [Pseudolabrys sp.]